MSYDDGDDVTTAALQSNDSPRESAVRICVIFIGILGSLTNLVELAYLFYSKLPYCCQHLMVNQSTIDAFACCFLALSYIIKRPHLHSLDGQSGPWLCTLFYSDTIVWVGLSGSATNWVLTAIHLYLFFRRRSVHLRLNRVWVKYLAIAGAWILGAAMNNPFQLSTYISHGDCYLSGPWTSPRGHLAYGIFASLLWYFIPLAVGGFCLGSLMISANTVNPSDLRARSLEEQGVLPSFESEGEVHVWSVRAANLALFALAWGPLYVYLLFWSRYNESSQLNETYVGTLCIGFVSVTIAPLLRIMSFCRCKQRLASTFQRFRAS